MILNNNLKVGSALFVISTIFLLSACNHEDKICIIDLSVKTRTYERSVVDIERYFQGAAPVVVDTTEVTINTIEYIENGVIYDQTTLDSYRVSEGDSLVMFSVCWPNRDVAWYMIRDGTLYELQIKRDWYETSKVISLLDEIGEQWISTWGHTKSTVIDTITYRYNNMCYPALVVEVSGLSSGKFIWASSVNLVEMEGINVVTGSNTMVYEKYRLISISR